MRLSVASKIIIFTAVLILAAALSLGLYFVKDQEEEMLAGLDKFGVTLAKSVADNSDWAVLSGDKNELNRIIGLVASHEKEVASIEVMGLDGTVLAKTENKGSSGKIKEYSSQIFQRSALTFDDLAGGDILPRSEYKVIGKIKLALTLSFIENSIHKMIVVSAFIIGLVVILGIIGILLIVNYFITKPFVILLSGINKITQGDLSQEIRIKTHDEIGQLAESFNEMAKALDITHVSREYFSEIINSMFNSLVVVDNHGIIKMVNLATSEMLKYKEHELLGRPLSVLFAEEPPSVESLPSLTNAEKLYVAKDGVGIPIIFSVSSMRDKAKEDVDFICVAQDITERKWSEEKLRVFTQELERSNQELEQFAYIASHDLQEPLRMVASYIQLLERRYRSQLGQEADEFIDYAVGGVKRMQNLIDALLSYSRVGRKSNPLVEVEGESVFKKVMDNLQIAISDSSALITHDPLPAVVVDEILLIQLLQNLIANAIKFRIENKPPVIHVSVKDNGFEWLFGVKDNGIGIDPQYNDRIFVIFQRLQPREKYPGTGIGLAVCKKIVDRLGGKIWVESKPGEGAVFYFTIPKSRLVISEYIK